MIDWKFIINKYKRKIFGDPFPEPDVLKVLKKIRGEIFFDIGANSGMFSWALRWNFNRIYAFEADPKIFDGFKAKRMNIIPVRAAVSDRNGWTYLYRPKDTCPTIMDGFRFCPPSDSTKDIFVQSEENAGYVPSITIDKFMSIMAIEYVDLVKIDVEGAEFMVLDGCKRVMGRIGNFMIELHNRNRKTELEKILQDNSFIKSWVDPDHVWARLVPDYD